MIQAIRDNDPVVFFEHKAMYDDVGEVPDEAYTIPFGEANVLREGEDATIVAIGKMVHLASEAADNLAKDGISCALIDPRTLSPLDEETILEEVEATGRLVVVDESHPRCSVAADISSIVGEKAFKSLKTGVQKVTAPHCPVPFASELEDIYMPTVEDVEAAVHRTMA